MSKELDAFNNFCAEVEPAEPMEYLGIGEYQGWITSVEYKEWQGTPTWNIRFKCSEGVTMQTIYGFTEADFMRLSDPEHQAKMTKKLAIIKRLFVDVGLPKPDSWSTGKHSILGMLPMLEGRKCKAVVRPHYNNPDKTITYLGKPDEVGTVAMPKQSPVINPTESLDDIPF